MDLGDSNRCSHGPLQLHVPLISTRRLANLPHLNTNCDHSYVDHASETTRMVPFQWEKVPGTPKCLDQRENPGDDKSLLPPPPKLPPARQHYPTKQGGLIGSDNTEREDNNDDIDDEDDRYFDATDMFSFFESYCVEGGAGGVNMLDGLDSGVVQCRGNQSPNFIMNRFLPAANALACASTSRKLNKKVRHQDQGKKYASSYCSVPAYKLREGMVLGARSGRSQPHSVPVSCGHLFFPWSLKHALCGLKSPAHSCTASNVKLKKCPPIHGDQSSSKISDAVDHVDDIKYKGHGWSFPVLESPCESWLSHAVSSVHEKRA